jgi:mRNA-degrading endonuclease YafQ of YafQ-DinJ toxin-antitoxin module
MENEFKCVPKKKKPLTDKLDGISRKLSNPKYQFRTKWMGKWSEWRDCHVSVYQEAKALKDKTFQSRKITNG